jgi:hypothetical protein
MEAEAAIRKPLLADAPPVCAVNVLIRAFQVQATLLTFAACRLQLSLLLLLLLTRGGW